MVHPSNSFVHICKNGTMFMGSRYDLSSPVVVVPPFQVGDVHSKQADFVEFGAWHERSTFGKFGMAVDYSQVAYVILNDEEAEEYSRLSDGGVNIVPYAGESDVWGVLAFNNETMGPFSSFQEARQAARERVKGTYLAQVLIAEPAHAGSPSVPAENFMGTLSVNVDNDRLSDTEFRQFVRNSLPVVVFPRVTDRAA